MVGGTRTIGTVLCLGLRQVDAAHVVLLTLRLHASRLLYHTLYLYTSILLFCVAYVAEVACVA